MHCKFEVLKCDDGKTLRWQPADEVNLVQFFDYEMSRAISRCFPTKGRTAGPVEISR